MEAGKVMSKANYGNLPINHSEEPIRLFKSDFLEFFTHIHPAVVLVLYVPVVVFFLARSYVDCVSAGAMTPPWGGYVLGLLLWAVSEYPPHPVFFHFQPSPER